MELIIGFILAFVVITFFAIYIGVTLKRHKPSDEETSAMTQRKFEIQEDFPTTTIQATVTDLQCKAELVGIKRPKAVEIFTVVFETANNEILNINVPKEMYDGIEVGQQGMLTLVEGELYSFVI